MGSDPLGRWQFNGRTRPSFALPPGPRQESVWDYPRPPRIEPEQRRVEVSMGGTRVADSLRGLRVLETASPPTVYVPRDDVRVDLLVATMERSTCEWKGNAAYWSLRIGGALIENVAWSYPAPCDEFASIAGHLAFYPALAECWLGGERVRAQPGGFYGGWVTSELVGPFKGEPGTEHW